MENVLKIDVEKLDLYKKRKVKIHYLKSQDIACDNQPITIHTLEGDVTICVDENSYIMIGPSADIYPISKELFDSRYKDIEDEIDANTRDIIAQNGWNLEKVRSCENVIDSYIYAKQILESFAVYVKHCDSIIYGKPGDYYVRAYEDTENTYIINGDIMELTYFKIP